MQLKRILDAFDVRSDSYAVDDASANEVYSILEEADGWHVFYAERGIRRDEQVYRTEGPALRDFLERIARDPLTRRPR